MSPFVQPRPVAGSVARSLSKRARGTRASAEQRGFVAAMGLPDPVIRRLAGRPIVIDGEPLAADVQLMLKLARATGPAVEELPVPVGRVALLRSCRLSGGTPPIGRVTDLTVAGLAARLYQPTGARPGTGPGPLLVFFHGGGFIYGDLDSHDAGVRVLAENSGVRVLSVEYRLAPEDPFPAAYDDAMAAFAWVHAHAAELDTDPGRIGVGGDSAGGNLAAGVALAVGEQCAFQLLIYPVTETSGVRSTSRQLFGDGFFLTDGFIDLALLSYVPDGADPWDPRLAPLYADVPAGLAPAYVATAGFDPLRDEGEAYAAKLAQAGVAVESKRFGDQIHGFFNTVLVRSARRAALELADALARGLA